MPRRGGRGGLVETRISFPYPFSAPALPRSNDSIVTIQRVEASLRGIVGADAPTGTDITTPVAVALGPYHHDARGLETMEAAKRAALEEFCRAANQPLKAVDASIFPVALSCRRYYADDYTLGAWKDPLMSRVEVHTCVDAIARDVMLLENQIPWPVLEALMALRPGGVPVGRFLSLMASAFDSGNDDQATGSHLLHGVVADPPPPHLLGLFYRRQVDPARTQSLRVPRLSSHTSTAVELAEMGVKLAASRSNKFGDMAMAKRRRRGVSGELSLAPVALNDVTACWLVNMAAYEACLGAALPDNFAVSSYISVVALLVNREQDVQELRARGIVSSTLSDMDTLHFFKTIVAVLSILGVLAGLFKTILSLKQPQQ
ncbi:unnamed protein product [Urochloa decumbens]|uniref:Uncharacterized protein n=1 Tax=Urochloa decumbens TaxID=240449 RepID=A0ABC9AS12_9POAL